MRSLSLSLFSFSSFPSICPLPCLLSSKCASTTSLSLLASAPSARWCRSSSTIWSAARLPRRTGRNCPLRRLNRMDRYDYSGATTGAAGRGAHLRQRRHAANALTGVSRALLPVRAHIRRAPHNLFIRRHRRPRMGSLCNCTVNMCARSARDAPVRVASTRRCTKNNQRHRQTDA